MKFRPLHDFILVRMEDDKKPEGQLIDLVHRNRVVTAEVLAVGNGPRHPKTGKRQPLGLEVGERVAFFRGHALHAQAEQVRQVFYQFKGEKNTMLIKAMDVLFVVEEGDPVIT